MEYIIKPNTIKMWAEDDRPREKMKQRGDNALSNSELIAILIGSGTRNKSAVDVAKELLNEANNDLQLLAKKDIHEYQLIKGIGEAKAIKIAAALELGKRQKFADISTASKVVSPNDAYRHLTPYFQDEIVELFYIILLNRRNHILDTVLISKGGTGGTIVDPKIIFKKALSLNSNCIILSHNHPGGTLQPSKEDIRLTKKLVEFGKMMELPIVDHIIYTDDGYYSFADQGAI